MLNKTVDGKEIVDKEKYPLVKSYASTSVYLFVFKIIDREN